jgi:PAS domain-containing protein
MLKLERQTQCTAAVAEASGAFYLILDPEGRVEQVSPLCRRTMNKDPEQLPGHLLWEVCDLAVLESQEVRDAIRQVAFGDSTVRARAADLVWNFTPIRCKEGQLTAIVATAFRSGEERAGSPRCVCSKPDNGTR